MSIHDVHFCVSRRAALPPSIHRTEGIILHGLLHVRPGNQLNWAFPRCRRHARPLQRVWHHVQHALHHPIQPDCRVSAWRRGTGLTGDKFCTAAGGAALVEENTLNQRVAERDLLQSLKKFSPKVGQQSTVGQSV